MTDQLPKERPRAKRRGPISLFADFVLALQERILWPLSDAVRAFLAVIGRSLAGLGRGFKRVFVWPIADRFALLGSFSRVGLVAGLALVIGVGVAAGLSSGGGGGSQPTEVKAVAAGPIPGPSAAVHTPAPAPAPKPEETLHGPAPSFTPPKAKAEPTKAAAPKPHPKEDTQAEASEPAQNSTNSTSEEPAETTGSGSAPAGSEKIGIYPTASRPTTAEASEIPGPTAGAAALAVAREFSAAFVVYETKGKSDEVRKAFAASSTPELAKALLERPPTQPAKVTVPKAKVLNIVPGPSRGSVFTVSVSLLRVGVTSELRLEMEKLKKQGWRVTNVLG